MSEKQDPAQTMLTLAVGYFVIGPLLMIAMYAAALLIGWAA